MKGTIGLVTAGICVVGSLASASLRKARSVMAVKKRTVGAHKLVPLALRERLVTNPEDRTMVLRARGACALRRRSGSVTTTEVDRYLLWRSFGWSHSGAIDAVLDHRRALLEQQRYQEAGDTI